MNLYALVGLIVLALVGIPCGTMGVIAIWRHFHKAPNGSDSDTRFAFKVANICLVPLTIYGIVTTHAFMKYGEDGFFGMFGLALYVIIPVIMVVTNMFYERNN